MRKPLTYAGAALLGIAVTNFAFIPMSHAAVSSLDKVAFACADFFTGTGNETAVEYVGELGDKLKKEALEQCGLCKSPLDACSIADMTDECVAIESGTENNPQECLIFPDKQPMDETTLMDEKSFEVPIPGSEATVTQTLGEVTGVACNPLQSAGITMAGGASFAGGTVKLGVTITGSLNTAWYMTPAHECSPTTKDPQGTAQGYYVLQDGDAKGTFRFEIGAGGEVAFPQGNTEVFINFNVNCQNTAGGGNHGVKIRKTSCRESS